MRTMRLTVAATLVAALGCSGSDATPTVTTTAAAPAPAEGSKEWKIQTAMSAGPTAIAQGATIMDMSATVDSLTVLRTGTNGWTCVADALGPHHPGPMCVDGQWMKWMEAYMAHKPPAISAVGTAYMLAGANDPSNTDPYATAPAAGKDWVTSGPHLMVITSGAHAYDALPHEPANEVPYVMFLGTPYAHVMVPVPGAHGVGPN